MRQHFEAVKNRLLTDSALAAKGVHDTALVDTAGKPVAGTYVVLFGGIPDSFDDGRLTIVNKADSDAEYLFTCRAVSTTADGVRSISQKVMNLLIGWTPNVSGRKCTPIEFDFSSDVRSDMSILPPLFYADIDVKFNSSRASA